MTTPYKLGDQVRAFDPRTMGVVKIGTVTKVGRKYLTLDFGLTGSCRVPYRDVLQWVGVSLSAPALQAEADRLKREADRG